MPKPLFHWNRWPEDTGPEGSRRRHALDTELRAPHTQPQAWGPREPASGWDGLPSPGALWSQLEAQPCCPSVGETRTHLRVRPMSPSGKADDRSLEGRLGGRPGPQDHVLTRAHGTPGVFSAALQSSRLPTAVKWETREWGGAGPFHTLPRRPRLVPRLTPKFTAPPPPRARPAPGWAIRDLMGASLCHSSPWTRDTDGFHVRIQRGQVV